MTNIEIADKIKKLADLLEIQGANPFRIRAYRKAALVIQDLSHNVVDLLNEGSDLTELPGIGKAIAFKIKALVDTGELPLLHKIEKQMPPELSQLLMIEGLGPKRIKTLHTQLHINNIDDLRKALEAGKVAELRGFGSKSEAAIKRGIKNIGKASKRLKLSYSENIAEAVVKYLKSIPETGKVEMAGSYRRRKEDIGDLDILATADNSTRVINHFVNFDEVLYVIAQGNTRASVFLKSGIQVDLRVVPKKSFGAALLYFTGSKNHNIDLRQMAIKKQLKINEYGVFKGKRQIAGKTEKEVYACIGLPYIPPELRESHGEINAALENKLPKLIELKDIRGDLHSHTNATDGRFSLREMAEAAQELGYEYLAITDHSKRLAMVHGLDEKRLLQQIRMIDKLNEKLTGITILKSIEVDILEDGSLDLSTSVLKELDLRVCAIHHQFKLPEKIQTERILRAMDSPYFNILAHATGRLLNSRQPYPLNMERIIKKAKENNCLLEINAQPSRLDINDIYCRMGKEIGVKFVISTDAHSINNFRYMQLGVDVARRGWLEKKDVINTRSLKHLKKYFAAK